MIISGPQPYIPLFRPDGNIRFLDRKLEEMGL